MPENNNTSRQEERRLELRALIKAAVGDDVRLYFQPPSNIDMVFPCVVYIRKDVLSERAGNKRYVSHESYDVTYISENSDNDILFKLLDIPMSEFDRRFVSDNLYHDVINIHI